MKKFNFKKVLGNSPAVDVDMLRKSLVLSKKLRALSGGATKGYDLPAPYTKRPIGPQRRTLHPA